MAKIINKKIKAVNRHWKNFLDKNYLGSHNLEEGEEMLVTIEKLVGEEEVKGTDGKANVKPVLYFKEDVPKMIMNITNGNTISALYGSHPDKWVGKQVQLFSASVKAFGKTQDALRVRDFKPQVAVDISAWTSKLDTAQSLNELGNIWKGLPLTVKSNKEVENYKNLLKTKLQ